MDANLLGTIIFSVIWLIVALSLFGYAMRMLWKLEKRQQAHNARLNNINNKVI